jgi:hypothetical protein
MNKINTDARLPQNGDMPTLLRRLAEVQREVATLVNALAEGRIAAIVNAATAAPTTGSYAVGDVVRNSNPVESGTAGSKYVTASWLCVSSSPLTFVEQRALTGH